MSGISGVDRRESDLRGRRVLVMGLGTRQGGVGVTRFLASRGAEVTVTDLRGPDDLEPALQAIADLPVRLRLGEHRREDFAAAEIVVRNPGVPADSEWLALARANGARIEMEMSLFFRACPAPIIGVAGTKGKTTTATLCHAILDHWRSDSILAGNMGRSALETLERISPDTPVVLELSSWQLEGLAEHGLSPHIAVLTSISEDHLDRYPSYEAYIQAEYQITRFQSPSDWLVVNRDDALAWAGREVGRARVVPFGVGRGAGTGLEAFLDNDRLIWRGAAGEQEIIRREELPLSGAHAALNALAASAAALLAGAGVSDARAALRFARGVAHRQELVATVAGVRYVNDTTATAPAAAVIALETFAGAPIVLIAGGASKRVPLEGFAREAARRAEAIVLLAGDATPELREHLEAAGARHISGPHGSMEEAVRAAARLARPGAVVLLSPACASFGLFRDEFHRGETFRAAVRALQTPAAEQGC